MRSFRSFIKERRIDTKRGQRFRYHFNEPLATSTNFAIGFVSAFFGTGGGFLRTPLLVGVFNFPVRVAVATSVFALSFYSTVGSVVHASLLHVSMVPDGPVRGDWHTHRRTDRGAAGCEDPGRLDRQAARPASLRHGQSGTLRGHTGLKITFEFREAQT